MYVCMYVYTYTLMYVYIYMRIHRRGTTGLALVHLSEPGSEPSSV